MLIVMRQSSEFWSMGCWVPGFILLYAIIIAVCIRFALWLTRDQPPRPPRRQKDKKL
jgi:hypothetical protein